VAEADRYGLIEIPEQEHELWLDTNYEYSIARFHEELATKMFRGHLKQFQHGFLTRILGLSGRLGGMSTSNR
jgi:hypothetical protein